MERFFFIFFNFFSMSSSPEAGQYRWGGYNFSHLLRTTLRCVVACTDKGEGNTENEVALERGFDLGGDWAVHCDIVINRTKLEMCFVLFLSHFPLQYNFF